MRRSRQEPPNVPVLNAHPLDFPTGRRPSRTDNPFKIVVTPKKKENPLLRSYLIELTEQLAEGAKDGSLKGLGGFADYGENGYMLGLEGSYLEDPTAAVLPMKRLEKRVMDQIEQEE